MYYFVILKFAVKIRTEKLRKNKKVNKYFFFEMQIFIKNSKNGDDLALIEMQGDLESRLGSNVNVSGKFIGDLHYTKDGGTPILIIGHHILYGKKVKLDNPMVTLKKVHIEQENSTKTEYQVDSVIRHKLIFKSRPKPIIANVPKKI